MDDLESSTNPHDFQRHLLPYVRTRQEVLHIRRVCAAHLENQLERNGAQLPRILSNTTVLKGIHVPHVSVQGERRQLLESIHTNVDAQQAYNELSQQYVPENNDSTLPKAKTLYCIEDYLELVHKRQMFEKLCVLEKYLDEANSVTSKLAERIDEAVGRKLPQVPVELIASRETNITGSSDIENLVHKLERAVLAERRNLQTEKRHLKRIREQALNEPSSPTSTAAKIEALRKTRDALISWIEGQLSNSQETEVPQDLDSDTHKTLNDAFEDIKVQYSKYVTARKTLLDMLAMKHVNDVEITQHIDRPTDQDDQMSTMTALSIVPFLDKFIAMANERRLLNQQKASLTTNILARRKETLRVLDHLTSESHLLPNYPLPSTLNTSKDARTTFAEAVSGTTSIAEKTRCWTYASASSAMTTKDVVLEKFEEGSQALEEASTTLGTISKLLNNGGSRDSIDLWTTFDGQLGVLGRGDA